jgi:hypothetical protein
MARIPGAPIHKGGLLRRIFVWVVYSVTRRRVGKLITPVQVNAHHPTILWGYAQMEQSQAKSKLLDPKLKGLAELRAATLIGCPF